VSAFLFAKAYFFPDYSSFLLGVSDLLLLLLSSPWILLFSALIRLFSLEGNLVAVLSTIASVAINAAVRNYVGNKFESAPDTLP